MQTTSVIHDPDTGTLTLHLSTGEEFLITNPSVAQTLKDKISVGGMISDTQRKWLEHYRVERKISNRDRVLETLGKIRDELRSSMCR